MTKKRLSEEDMERLEALLETNEKQNHTLNEILTCIKGNEELGIEGIIGAQKRIEQSQKAIEEAIHKKISKIEETVKQINDWKNAVTLYIGMLTSARAWRILFILIAAFILGGLILKYGFYAVWEYVKKLLF